jgi:hypothetical protein
MGKSICFYDPPFICRIDTSVISKHLSFIDNLKQSVFDTAIVRFYCGLSRLKRGDAGAVFFKAYPKNV